MARSQIQRYVITGVIALVAVAVANRVAALAKIVYGTS